MNYLIDIQLASKHPLPLTKAEIKNLASLALRDHRNKAELTLRLVDADEMTSLNHQYRKKNKVTNVLAFPSAYPDIVELEHPFLGDVILCPEVIQTESQEQNKTIKAHWSLIVIHGVLHLLGYDHIKDNEAKVMQAIEIKLLAELGYENPYEIEDGEFE